MTPAQNTTAYIQGFEDGERFTKAKILQEMESDKREWVGLTDKAITKVIDSMPRGINGWMSDWDLYEFARAIEAKLKENT